jgi:cytochrome c biogenesis protein CcmG/thiol:disulfide interchange protein DsbE
VAFLVLAGFATAALMATLRGERDVSQLPSTMIGKAVPDVVLPRLDAEAGDVGPAQFAGAPLLVNVFASWCAPCQAEAPALAILEEDIRILGIAYKDKPADTRTFLQQYGNPFVAIGVDRDGAGGMALGVYGVPETFLLDADGTILLRHAGPIDRRVLEDILLPRIQELQ